LRTCAQNKVGGESSKCLNADLSHLAQNRSGRKRGNVRNGPNHTNLRTRFSREHTDDGTLSLTARIFRTQSQRQELPLRPSRPVGLGTDSILNLELEPSVGRSRGVAALEANGRSASASPMSDERANERARDLSAFTELSKGKRSDQSELTLDSHR
jgi:hypothetical protein